LFGGGWVERRRWVGVFGKVARREGGYNGRGEGDGTTPS